jgi:hypothetical protein
MNVYGDFLTEPFRSVVQIVVIHRKIDCFLFTSEKLMVLYTR